MQKRKRLAPLLAAVVLLAALAAPATILAEGTPSDGDTSSIAIIPTDGGESVSVPAVEEEEKAEDPAVEETETAGPTPAETEAGGEDTPTPPTAPGEADAPDSAFATAMAPALGETGSLFAPALAQLTAPGAVEVTGLTAGDLQDEIEALGLDTATITSLTVTGTVNHADMLYIWTVNNFPSAAPIEEQALPNLQELDLSGATASADNQLIVGFFRHPALRRVALPAGLSSIPLSIFRYCASLEAVDVSASASTITKVSTDAFESCASLQSIDLSACTNLAQIGIRAFQGCTALRRVVLPATGAPVNISADSFYNCNNVTVVVPGGMYNLYAADGNWLQAVGSGQVVLTSTDEATYGIAFQITKPTGGSVVSTHTQYGNGRVYAAEPVTATGVPNPGYTYEWTGYSVDGIPVAFTGETGPLNFTIGGLGTAAGLPPGDAILHITFIPIVYTITYELNGGINHANNPATYTVEDTVSLWPASRSSYIFDGWFRDASLSVPADDIQAGSRGDVTLYAKWVPETTTDPTTTDPTTTNPDTTSNPATTSRPGTLTVSGLPTKAIRVGDSFTLTPNDADTRSGSAGWAWDADYLSATFNSPATFTALKEGNTTITYTSADGRLVTVELSILRAHRSSGSASAGSAIAKTGDSFVVWPYLLLVLVAAACIIAFVTVKKRRAKTSR